MLAKKKVVLLSGKGKSLNLDFTQVQLDPRLTFTRSTIATCLAYAPTAVAGDLPLVTTCAINEARFQNARRVSQGVWSTVLNDGSAIPLPITLLAEEAGTNLCLQSEVLGTTWTTTGATVSSNTTLAPDGNTTADSIIPTSASSLHGVIQSVAKSASALTYTFSAFYKPLGYSYLSLRADATAGNGVWASFNTTTGVIATAATSAGTGWVPGTATITQAANGFYRCSMSFTTASETSVRVVPCVMDTNGNPFTSYNFVGNTTSGMAQWGAQLASAYSSYISTTTTALTRTLDSASFTGAGLSWYNPVQGTFVIKASGNAFRAPSAFGTFNLTLPTSGTYALVYNNSIKDGSTYLYTLAGGSTPVEYTGIADPITTVTLLNGGLINLSTFVYYPKALHLSKIISLLT
jgi:hypothetical protein